MKPTHQKEEMPPIFCNDEAERAVIGAIVVESTAISNLPFLTPEMFYIEKHAIIFKAALSLYDSGKQIDTISIIEEIKKSGKINEVGGIYGITELSLSVASSDHIEYHGRLIQQEFYRRSMYHTAENIMQLTLDPTQDVADILNIASSDFETINTQAYKSDENISIELSSYEAFQDYFKRADSVKNGNTFGINTGLDMLNKLTSGWQNSNLMILAARPAMGKTSVMLHMAKAAAKFGKNVVIFSLEMSHKELSSKLILSESGDVNANRFRNGQLYEDEITKIEIGTNAVLRLPIVINDKIDTMVRKIKNNARQLKKQGKCDIVFIDYLQLINMRQENKAYNREQEVSQTSRALKIMAKELEIPVIVLSQLSRNCEERKDKRPMLSDLRESGAIEQDADMVMFLWRPEYYEIEEYKGKSTKGVIVLDIAKGRNVPTCEIGFMYNEHFTKFYEQDEMPY